MRRSTIIDLKQSRTTTFFTEIATAPDSIGALAMTGEIRDTPMPGFAGGPGASSLPRVKCTCPAEQLPSGNTNHAAYRPLTYLSRLDYTGMCESGQWAAGFG